MKIVYTGEDAPLEFEQSLFLMGPTPRSEDVESWRPRALELLKSKGYEGVVFVPEYGDCKRTETYDDRVEWERRHLDMADAILAWVPRQLPDMPAFTTNVEFGKYVTSGRLVYGRPSESEKNTYLDWLYGVHNPDATIPNTLEAAIDLALARIGSSSKRVGGERYVPLQVWRTKMFQDWYASHLAKGNVLVDAKVLWNFTIPKINYLFSYVLWVNVWIEEEKRFKQNEFIFSRSDISCILPFWLDLESNSLLDTKVVLIKEFRSPVRNSDGFVHELPGGSSFKGTSDYLKLAAEELEEETGIKLPADRFRCVDGRQLASTLSTHKSMLFTVRLDEEEIRQAEELAAKGQVFGVEEDTERTYVEVKTLRDIIIEGTMDWSMIGMIFGGIATEDVARWRDG